MTFSYSAILFFAKVRLIIEVVALSFLRTEILITKFNIKKLLSNELNSFPNFIERH